MPYDELFYDTIEETDYFDFHNSDNNEPYRREWDSPLELFKNDELFIVEEHNKDFVKVIVTKENIEKRERLLKQLKIKFLEIEIKAIKITFLIVRTHHYLILRMMYLQKKKLSLQSITMDILINMVVL